MKYLIIVLVAALVLSVTDAAAQVARRQTNSTQATAKQNLTYLGCLKALRASEARGGK